MASKSSEEKENLKSNLIPIRENLLDYEQELADLELIRYRQHPDNFYKETAYQKRVGGKISYYHLFSKIRYGYKRKTEWGGHLSHSFDRYQGSFPAQVARALVNICNLKKEAIILDVFCGSGTSLVEGMLMGFTTIGIDNNPVACLSSRIKTLLLGTTVKTLTEDNKRYLNLNYYKKFRDLRTKTFLELDIKELFYLFLYIRACVDQIDYKIPIIHAFKRLYRDILKTIMEFSKLNHQINIPLGKVSVICDNNLSVLKKLKASCIDCVITSPPYITPMINYLGNYSQILQKHFFESDIKRARELQVGNRFKKAQVTVGTYWRSIENVLAELYRVVKNGSRVILVVGKDGLMKEKCVKIAERYGFILERAILKRYKDFKKQYYKYEYIIFLEKK